MTTLATTLGCLLLLANPQPSSIPAVIFAQEPAQAENPPEQSPAATQTTPDKTQQTSPDSSKPAPATPKKKAKAKTAARKKPAPKSSPSQENPIVVISNGGTADRQGQISYSATDQQTLEKRKNTDALLTDTATNLKQISGKQLNPSQEDMVKQIHNYMARSKDATTNGDVQGANNLAFKAHLLSEELIKP